MRRRAVTKRLRCSVPGCAGFGISQYDNQREYAESLFLDGQWRCPRHTGIVLTVESPKAEWVSEPSSPSTKYPQLPDLFWGSQGFAGAGEIKAWCNDFPAGTRVRIAMEIILPEVDSRV
jgi:hypothetical protein